MKKIAWGFVAGLLLFPSISQALSPQQVFDAASNRYSAHFDRYGLVNAAPSYGVPEWVALGPPRELALAAWYYLPRAQGGDANVTGRVHRLWAQTVASLSGTYLDSFATSQAAVLVLAIPPQLPSAFTPAEIAAAQATLAGHLPAAIASAEDSNRGVMVATLWSYVSSVLQARQVISADQDAAHQNAFNALLWSSINPRVDRAGWYREQGQLSLHYHAVTAFHLLWYGRLRSDPAAVALGRKMYRNLRHLSLANGLLETQIGNRPVGMGPQLAIMMGILALDTSDPAAAIYFKLLRGQRFFSDQRRPNRLEYHRTVAHQAPLYHDDIATSEVMMIAQIWPHLQLTRDLGPTVRFTVPVSVTAGTIRINNTRTRLTVDDRLQKKIISVQLGVTGLTTTISKRTY